MSTDFKNKIVLFCGTKSCVCVRNYLVETREKRITLVPIHYVWFDKKLFLSTIIYHLFLFFLLFVFPLMLALHTAYGFALSPDLLSTFSTHLSNFFESSPFLIPRGIH